MKITRFIPATLCSFLFAGATAALAQVAPASESMTAGFLGQDYAGAEFGYVRHQDGPPRVLHRYGFLASRPMPYHENVDGVFRYNYTHGADSGMDMNRHDFTAGLAGFKRNGLVAPFVEGGIGWAWSEVGNAQSNSFLYSVRGGVELQLSPSASLTPSLTYREARRFHDRAWIFGAKAGARLNQDWSATLTVQFDDADSHNVETAVGVQRRF